MKMSQFIIIIQSLKKFNLKKNTKIQQLMEFIQNRSLCETQKLIFQMKIQQLEDRLSCIKDQCKNLKTTNNLLLQRIKSLQQMEALVSEQRARNLQLREMLEIAQSRIQQEASRCHQRIENIEAELKEKEHFIQLLKIQQEKQILKKNQKINNLTQMLKEKNKKMSELDRKMHLKTIENYEDEAEDRSRIFMRSRIQQFQKTQTQYQNQYYNQSQYQQQNSNSMNVTCSATNKNNTSINEKRVLQLSKMTKDQMKVMIKSLKQAGNCLQMGGMQLSMIMDKGTRNSISKNSINRTTLE